jgi:hypothetical protein
MWISRIRSDVRESLPANTPPGRSTRNTSANNLSCSCGDGT